MWWMGALVVAAWMILGRPVVDKYVDRNGVVWAVYYDSSMDWWSVGTDGYGGMFKRVHGYQSRAQAIENIEENATRRDPETGAILKV